MNLETSCVNVRTLDESVKYSAIPEKKNEESVEDEVLTGENINAHEDLDE